MSKIRVVIRKDGTQSIEVIDGCGEACLELTRKLEDRLGKPVGDRELKPEIDEPEVEAERETDS